MVLSVCTEASFLATVLFIKKLIKVLTIIVPVILILLLSVDIAKAVIAGNDEQIKKAQKLAIKRLIYALLVFFVPIIVNSCFKMLGNRGVEGLSCYNNADDDTVDLLVQAEKEKLSLKEDEIQKTIEEFQKSLITQTEAIQKLRTDSAGTTTPTTSSSYVRANGKIAEASSSGLQVVSFSNGLKRWKWEYVFRFKDPRKALLAASCMEAGVKNNKNIKYCGKWGELYDKSKKYNFDVSKIKNKTCTTCSPFVSVCINYAGIKMKRGLNAASPTSPIKDFKKFSDDFEIIHNKKIAQDYTKLYRGDILFKNKYNGMGHMVMAT